MLLKWLDAREAAEVGNALADDFVLQTGRGSSSTARRNGPAGPTKDLQKFLQRFLQRVDADARPLRLNVFKRAKLANSFKWRLLEKGVEPEIVNELTQALVLRLTTGKASAALPEKSVPQTSGRRTAGNMQAMLSAAEANLVRGEYAEAESVCGELLSLDPRHAVARNHLGAALCGLGHYKDAEEQFRRAIHLREAFPDAQSNLGTVLRLTGRLAESEVPLRRALKMKPAHVDAQVSLGLTLLLLSRLREARECFERALRVAPRHVAALAGMAQITASEGRLEEATTLYTRVLEIDRKTASGWAGVAHLRKMTPGDTEWLKGAEEAAASGLSPVDEAMIRNAIGKYYNDVGDFARAFRSYQRANELRKPIAEPYDRRSHTRFVDDLIGLYTRESLSGAYAGASDSARPVFVVGMMRSGTSLVEQIIASHPAAKGAGELQFWTDAVSKHETAIRRELLGEALRRKLAAAYLRTLDTHGPGAERVVDKATFNSDYLGVIHSVFPNARMIYLRRDPIDSCLSCYFQLFSVGRSFTMDLADLAHYYREHHRLVAHWRRVLPEGTLLDVPYAELVEDQESWTRRIVDFLGLEWDDRCLDFHKTVRPVLTASNWQVRQKIYKSSVKRWRNYEKYIGPLLELKTLG